MRAKNFTCLCLISLLLSACGTRTKYPEATTEMTEQTADAFEIETLDTPPLDFDDNQMTDERYARADRLAVIANRLLVANRDMCGRYVMRSFLLRVKPRACPAGYYSTKR